MAIVGLFLGGSPGALIPAGYSQLNLHWAPQNRADTVGAMFTIDGGGESYQAEAGSDGRAHITVPSGTYTVSVAHEGVYDGDDPQTVVAESQKSYVVAFYGLKSVDIIDTWERYYGSSEL